MIRIFYPSIDLNAKPSFSVAKKKPLQHLYTIGDYILPCIRKVRNSGVLLDSELSFSKHIDLTTSKCKRLAGFIKRNSVNYKKLETKKLLFFALVRSILEFGAIIWDSHDKGKIEKIEKIQKTFLKYLNHELFTYYP